MKKFVSISTTLVLLAMPMMPLGAIAEDVQPEVDFVPLAEVSQSDVETVSTLTAEQNENFLLYGDPFLPEAVAEPAAAAVENKALAAITGSVAELNVIYNGPETSGPSYTNAVRIHGNYAYVNRLRNLNVPGVTDISTPGYNGQYEVWDVSNPASPTRIKVFDECLRNDPDNTACNMIDSEVVDNYLFVMQSGQFNLPGIPQLIPGGITVYDITNPADPVYVTHRYAYDLDGTNITLLGGTDIEVQKGEDGKYYIVAAASAQQRLQLWDFDATSKTLTFWGETYSRYYDLWFEGTTGLKVGAAARNNIYSPAIDFYTILTPPYQSSPWLAQTMNAPLPFGYPSGYPAYPIARYGEYYIMATSNMSSGGIYNDDIRVLRRDLYSMEQVGSAAIPDTTTTGNQPMGVWVMGDYALVLTGSTLGNTGRLGMIYAFDLTDPTMPVLAGKTPAGNWDNVPGSYAADVSLAKKIVMVAAYGVTGAPGAYIPRVKDLVIDVKSLSKDQDGDGVIDSDDDCPTIPGQVDRQGCPFADVLTFTVQTIGKGQATFEPKAGVEIKVFDAAVVGNVNPDKHGTVFESSNGFVGSCVTNGDGSCVVGEAEIKDYMVVAKFFDQETGKTVYLGQDKSVDDFYLGVAFLDLKLIKRYGKNGVFERYMPEGRVTTASSAQALVAAIGAAGSWLFPILIAVIGLALAYTYRAKLFKKQQ